MPIHTPDGTSFPEFADLADRVTNGDGVLWAGDPWCELRVGVLTDRRGRVKAHRLEVWRWCEDGEMRRLGSWHPSEQYKIPMDLAKMRADQPGGSQVIAEIDRHNAEMEDRAARAMRDEIGETVERLAHKLAFEVQGNARNTHQISENPLAS